MLPTMALVLLLPAGLGPARAQGGVAQGGVAQGGAAQEERLAYGKAVAESWCANCHVVGPGQRQSPGDAAPPFAAVARMPSTTEMSLRAFLQTPHARMPDYRLSTRELDSVVTYILGLRGGGGR
jgi:mono/diheme cytochrome c family protein